MAISSTNTGNPSFIKGIGQRLGGGVRSYLGTGVHSTGMRWMKEGYGFGRGMGTLGRTLGLGYLGFQAYSGYKQGGLGGAVVGIGKGAVESYLFGAGVKALGVAAVPLIGAGVMAGAAYGAYTISKAAREHEKKHAKLELARPLMDQFGTIATMRQRSIQAINNSHLNGRTALGNEASLYYKPYHR